MREICTSGLMRGAELSSSAPTRLQIRLANPRMGRTMTCSFAGLSFFRRQQTQKRASGTKPRLAAFVCGFSAFFAAACDSGKNAAIDLRSVAEQAAPGERKQVDPGRDMSAANGAPVSSPKVASPQVASPAKSAETPSPVLGTEEKLRQIVLGLYGYEFAHEHFPPAVVIGPDGKTPHSWRVEILPYLHRKDLFEQYRLDEPWDSPANKKGTRPNPRCFSEPV